MIANAAFVAGEMLAMQGSRVLSSLASVSEVDQCTAGVYECSYLSFLEQLPTDAETCALYNENYKLIEGNWIIMALTFIGMAMMAFAIGANDAANAWSACVHSFALKLSTACILGGFLEVLGATTLGYGVSTSIQSGITDYTRADCFACGRCDSQMTRYYIGMMSALYGAGGFIVICSFFHMPVSSTHSVVGAVIGMTVSSVGFNCLSAGWNNLGGIIASWGISPLLSGVVSVVLYYATHRIIFQSANPRRNAIIALPILYFSVVFFILFLSISKAPVLDGMNPWYGPIVGLCGATAVAVGVITILIPNLKKNMPSVKAHNKLNKENLLQIAGITEREALASADGGTSGKERKTLPSLLEESAQAAAVALPRISIEAPNIHVANPLVTKSPTLTPSCEESGQKFEGMDLDRASMQILAEYEALEEQQEDAMWMFKYLLIVAASLDAYAHGSNDTANATAAFSAVVNGFKANGRHSCGTPDSQWWVMLIGGVFLALGIFFLGYKVMATLGKGLTLFNYHRGFCVELGSAITVVIASLMNFPVSSTHCQVGSVVFIGIAVYGVRNVQWKLLTSIFSAWIFTLPASATLTAVMSWLIQYAFRA